MLGFDYIKDVVWSISADWQGSLAAWWEREEELVNLVAWLFSGIRHKIKLQNIDEIDVKIRI